MTYVVILIIVRSVYLLCEKTLNKKEEEESWSIGHDIVSVRPIYAHNHRR